MTNYPLNQRFIIVPGWKNSGPQHWQTYWEQSLPNASRVEQANWLEPTLESWLSGLDLAIQQGREAPILIAHSLGCITAVHWALNQQPGTIRGLFLVAPADVARPNAPDAIRSFSPVPLHALPMPSVVVASTNDPYCSLDRAALFAKSWGAAFVTLPDALHINAESGHQIWEEGKLLLFRFLADSVPAAA